MSASEVRWRAGDLAAAALDLAPTEVERLLNRECRDNPGLRLEVERLLAADALAEGFLERPPRSADDEGPDLGDRLGAYKLIRLLGEGGASRVFLGHRVDDAFQNQVAVKVIRPGRGGPGLLRRFCRERQILARFDHPNIARLFDGGSAPSGLPYFVLEWVDGDPIDVHCDAAGLGIEARIELLLTVCSAVAYAHQRQVVHRDLKPANILVTGAGVVKLLDFGIAKLLAPEVVLETLQTAPFERLLTPRYASPEQLRGEPVTTATDSYALGLILFELLVGRSAFEVEGRSFEELVRERSEVPAPRPSQVLRGLDPDSGRRLAECRGSRSTQLRWCLEGNLDSIVGKALRADPGERYATVEQLADDLRRHLCGLPVEAREWTWRYDGANFVRRYRWEVTAVLLVVAVILGFFTSTLLQTVALRAQRNLAETQGTVAVEARQQATRSQELMLGILNAVDPREGDNRGLTPLELLDQAVQEVHRRFEDDSAVPPAVLNKIGDLYRELGSLERAESYLTQALEIQREAMSAPDLLETRVQMGLLREAQGRTYEARAFFDRAIAQGAEHLGESDPRVEIARLHRARMLDEARGIDGADGFGQGPHPGPRHEGESPWRRLEAETSLVETED